MLDPTRIAEGLKALWGSPRGDVGKHLMGVSDRSGRVALPPTARNSIHSALPSQSLSKTAPLRGIVLRQGAGARFPELVEIERRRFLR